MKKILISTTLILLPIVTHAQTVHTLVRNIGKFFSNIIIPFLMAVAFLFFVFNVFRYFILGGANKDDRDKAKAQAIYGITAFVLIIIFWGIVNMFADMIGLEGKEPVRSDYVSKTEVG
ncbi:hypothetical protein KC851_04120 [Candidatus Kaiserbacteria bacterium]|nr:hypothetical protein [Candidatus Kaiserbacteria bacterium]